MLFSALDLPDHPGSRIRVTYHADTSVFQLPVAAPISPCRHGKIFRSHGIFVPDILTSVTQLIPRSTQLGRPASAVTGTICGLLDCQKSLAYALPMIGAGEYVVREKSQEKRM